MPQVIDITDDDIRYAERILLPEGKEFDQERRDFICDFRTLDLQAVPGSGKTTALLAKLVILERKLPFSDGSGVLVISHTNAAIDEIRHKIQKHCPKLFSYPNFIGTVQSFVDEFMAIPFYISTFKKKPNRIDNEIYDEAVNKYLKLNLKNFSVQEQKNAKYFLNGNNCQFSFRLSHLNNTTVVVSSINGNELQINKPKKGKNWQDFSDSEKTRIKEWLVKFKYTIMQHEGVLHFDDAYFLADVYLNKIPKIKTVLQKRFSFVFVDEMQDLDNHQYSLLEKVFYADATSISIIQRIGDKNQAIYSGSSNVKTDEVWKLRDTPHSVLSLRGSQRLSKPIADVVKMFALYTEHDFDIVGLNECEIKPQIFLFEDSTIAGIIPYFAQVVKEYRESGSLINQNKPVKVICWNTDWKDNDASRADISKLRLEDYFNGFKKEKSKPRVDYDCLKSYLLFYDKSKNTLEPIRKNILNAFLKILRLEGVNGGDGRSYTKKTMIDFIREADSQKYDEINRNIYDWSFGVIKGEIDAVWVSVRDYVPIFFRVFSNNALSASSNFLTSDSSGVQLSVEDEPPTTNSFKDGDLEIEIASVHAVKGQTHSATLYLESSYYNDSGKSYESERLANQFLGNIISGNIGERVKQSAKMAYVGFSRPTDLLCIAIHKTRFDGYLSSIDTEKWDIREVSLVVY